MKKAVILSMLAAAGLVAGSVTTLAQAAGDKPVTVKLEAQNNSGESGTATLTPQGEKTQVSIKLTGAPAGVAQPTHIHAGTCANLDPKPKIPLDNVVDGNSTTVVGVKLSDILGGPHAINVHKSAQEAKIYVACGDLKAGG